MSRAWLLVLLAVALAVGAAFALGLVGGDGPVTGDAETLRGEERPPEGPTGPLREEDDASRAAARAARLTGRPGESPLAPRPPRLRAATVRVVDAAGIPLAGQVVSVFVGDVLHGHFTSGADGRIRIPDLPVGAEVFVALGALDGRPDSVLALTGDTLELRASNVLPLRVDVVDAETGALLPGARWVFTTPELRGGVLPIDSGASTPIHVQPGRELKRPYAAETPHDYVDWDPHWGGVIARYATSLVARHPLRREATVTVQTVDAEKEDVRDAQVHAFLVGGRGDVSPQTGPWMLGGIRLRGVPFFAGQPLQVWARAPEDRGGDATLPLPAEEHEELVVELVLRKGYRLPVPNEELPWGTIWTDEPRRNPPFRAGLRADGPDVLLGGLEVQVIRADGGPAVGAAIRLPLAGEHRTDETGVLHVEKMVAGEHEVTLDEPGLVPVSTTAQVVAGELTHVTLQEPVGATLVVTVKAADGTPLPHAMVVIGQAVGSPWVDLAPDGLQRLDPYADARGRRTFRRVQPGRIRLDGWWGGWEGTLVVTVGDRQTEDVTLLLR